MSRIAKIAAIAVLLGLSEGLPADVDGTTAAEAQAAVSGDQARRGEALYPSICGRCHGYKLDGAPDDPDMLPAPPLAGPKFLRKWQGADLAALFDYIRSTMPALNPGSLSDEEYVDVLSYMLAVGGISPGLDRLDPDSRALSGLYLPMQADTSAAAGPESLPR